ncbi:SgcJ/EcaC family oxidoreductase [Brevibacterium aurantiacum]|uniref:SgcJ/EcaC family oxidoreductase n=1 Tax=Brevibacterium aurantiacum TaxID=273384 RepID=A0A556C8U7_BREAU|nr:SgcJ/EcaC family oxidoreductase [Brevibacterium aurantiacum]TSI13873.1 SgcJ/EcaC family oxidoreductase [Brevibacterium aurantiacum]
MSADNEVRTLYLRLLTAWNERDAHAMSACFAAEGVMIGFDGSVTDGASSVLDHLSPIFADHPTAQFVTLIRSVRGTGNVRILLADAGMVPPGAAQINPDANARQSLVARRTDETWQVELFQNTPTALHWDEALRISLSEELNTARRERGLLPN